MTGERDDKATMTLNLSRREMDVVEQLADEKDLNKTQLIRQALRVYQLIHIRIKNGERMFFSGDEQRAIEFVGLGLDPLTKIREEQWANRFYWLIERNDLGAPQYRRRGPGDPWTAVASEALQFARQEDATCYIHRHEANDPALKAVEHADVAALERAKEQTP